MVTRKVLASIALSVTVSAASLSSSHFRSPICGLEDTPRSTTSTIDQLFFLASHGFLAWFAVSMVSVAALILKPALLKTEASENVTS